MGAACSLNAWHCGRVHCTFTGPLYGLMGLAALAHEAGWIRLASGWFWTVGIVGTIAAFLPEGLGRRYWRKKSLRTDPVCGAPIEEKQAGCVADFGGQTFYFCSLDCKVQFLENPMEHLAKQQGNTAGCCG